MCAAWSTGWRRDGSAMLRSAFRRIPSRLRLSRPVLLLESCWIQTPLVVDFFPPAILMPLGLLSGFQAEQVEAFLMHDLAHVGRGDYLVNLSRAWSKACCCFNPGFGGFQR